MSDILDPNGEVQIYNAERVDYIPGIADFQYLRARYYTPDTARFIQQDTVWGKIDVPLSQNLYAYCGNNPLNFVDPSGHMAENIKDKIDALEKSLARAKNVGAGLSVYTEIETQINLLFTVSDIEKAENGSERDNCEVMYSKYGESVTHNNYAILTDIDLIARLIFHEDGHMDGQDAIAWTIHNRLISPTGSGVHDDYAILIYEGYTNFMGNDKDGLNKFWSTNEWLSDNKKWYFGAAKGSDTQSSWEHAVDLAIALVESENDTEKFERTVANPFIGYFDNSINLSDIKYYVNKLYSNDANQVKIGSNYFSNLPH